MSNKKYKQGKFGYAVIAILIVIGGAGNAEAGLSCTRITSLLMPCLGYLNGRGGARPPGDCCRGVGTVLGGSRSTADRQATCRCLLSQYRTGQYHVRVAYARTLASSCRLKLPVPPSAISSTIDCSKI